MYSNEKPGVIGVAKLSESFNSEIILVAEQVVSPSMRVECLSTYRVLVMIGILHLCVGCRIQTLESLFWESGAIVFLGCG